METATLLEVGWTIAMLVAATFQGVHVWRAIQNYYAARDNDGTPTMMLMAKQKIRNHVTRLFTLIAFLFIGLWAMLNAAGFLTAGALLSIGAVVILDTVLDHLDWPRLIGGD